MDVVKSKGSDTTGASHSSTRESCGKKEEKTEGNRSSYQFKREMANRAHAEPHASLTSISQLPGSKMAVLQAHLEDETSQIEK